MNFLCLCRCRKVLYMSGRCSVHLPWLSGAFQLGRDKSGPVWPRCQTPSPFPRLPVSFQGNWSSRHWRTETEKEKRENSEMKCRKMFKAMFVQVVRFKVTKVCYHHTPKFSSLHCLLPIVCVQVELAVHYKFHRWICGMLNAEFFACMASKMQGHVNLYVEPGANKGYWMC